MKAMINFAAEKSDLEAFVFVMDPCTLGSGRTTTPTAILPKPQITEEE